MRSGRYLARLRTGAPVILGALLLGGVTPAAAITCSTRSTVKNPFYPGKAASDVYDNRFKESHEIPFLPAYVPQGLATWSDWPHGSGDDLLVITAYDPDGGQALIIGIDAKTGTQMGAARIANSHVGGIAVFEKLGWAFVSDERAGTVRRYSLAKLADAISISDKKTIQPDGADQPVIGSSFLTSHEPTSTLWAGQFKASAKDGRPLMKSYKVGDNGRLTPQTGLWQVPIKTQGAIVTKDLLIYSTSLGRNNRSNLYVVRRGKDEAVLEDARLFCFRSPSMSEGIAVFGDGVHVVYESGASIFNPAEGPGPGPDKPDRPRNIIRNLHKATLESLEELAPRSGPTRPGPTAPDKRKRPQLADECSGADRGSQQPRRCRCYSPPCRAQEAAEVARTSLTSELVRAHRDVQDGPCRMATGWTEPNSGAGRDDCRAAAITDRPALPGRPCL